MWAIYDFKLKFHLLSEDGKKKAIQDMTALAKQWKDQQDKKQVPKNQQPNAVLIDAIPDLEKCQQTLGLVGASR